MLFRSEGRADVLVATDVAARGIHIEALPCVIHYDPPQQSEDYIHRSGRTGRAGETGTVVSIILPDLIGKTKRMQKELGFTPRVDQRDNSTPQQLVVRELSMAPLVGRATKSEPVPSLDAIRALINEQEARDAESTRQSKASSTRTGSRERSPRGPRSQHAPRGERSFREDRRPNGQNRDRTRHDDAREPREQIGRAHV